MLSQSTQVVAQKLHKTPQIKPSVPGLTISGNTIPDNYSNDDKANEGFALPLVGSRRKASEAGFSKPTAAQQLKRQHCQNQQHAVRRDQCDIETGGLEMKKTKSAYLTTEKPFN